jgi:hypothetical protein
VAAIQISVLKRGKTPRLTAKPMPYICFFPYRFRYPGESCKSVWPVYQ